MTFTKSYTSYWLRWTQERNQNKNKSNLILLLKLPRNGITKSKPRFELLDACREKSNPLVLVLARNGNQKLKLLSTGFNQEKKKKR